MADTANIFDDPNYIWKVLVLLINVQTSLVEKTNKRNSPIQIFAQQHYPPIYREMIENNKDAPWQFDNNLYLHLPLVDSGGWKQQPIVRASFEDQGGLKIFRFQVGLLVEEKDKVGEADKKHHGIGMRFESPEGPGVHNYYHAQFFTQFRDGKKLDNSPDWLPDSHPAVPIPAENAVDIIFCAVKSLYGITHDFWKMLIAEVRRVGLSRDLDKEICKRIMNWATNNPTIAFA